jgi:hypothetical protein
MLQLNFYLVEKSYYQYKQPEKTMPQDTYIIGSFLTSSVVSYPDSFKKWVLNSASNHTAGNSTFLNKEDKYIILRDRLPIEYADDLEVYILKTEMLRLLDWWQDLCKHKPAQAHLIFDGEAFYFDPNYDNSATGSFLTIC